MSSKETLIIQFERLYRHYMIVLNTYDQISLLDLAHSLRIWIELKNQIDKNIYPNISKPFFISSSSVRKIKKITNGKEYVWCGFGKHPVISYASAGEVLFCPYTKNGTVGLKFKRNEKNGIEIYTVHFVKTEIDEPNISNNVFLQQIFTKTNFTNWLNTEAIQYYSERDNKKYCISREILVKRLANAFEASHPTKDNQDSTNIFDGPIKYLLSFTCGGLPLPYYVTLKIAQDIIITMPKILGIEEKII